MPETIPRTELSKNEENIDLNLPNKQYDVRQQISKRVRILMATAENDSVCQIARESGLSDNLLRPWHQRWEELQQEESGGLNIEGQPEDRSHASVPSNFTSNQLPDRHQFADENLEVSGWPNIHRSSQETADKPIKRRRLEYDYPSHASWLPERREDKMNDVVELRRVVSVLVRWWWLILLLTFVAAAVGFAVSLRLDPVYRASASVIVGQSIQATSLDSRDIQTSERLALSYADIARRQPILEAANVSLNLGYPWQDLRKRVRVELVPDTQLIEISVEAGSRDEAIEIADEIARQLILLSPTSLPNQQDENTTLFVHTRLQALQNKIQANQEKLDVLSSELLEAPTFEQKAELQAEINNLESMIVDWEDNYAKFLAYAGSEESANYLAIVETAHGRVTPIRPVIRLNTIIAGAVGLVLALGLVLLLDFLDDTLKKPDDISQDLNLVPLGSIGQFGGRDPQKRKIIANDPFSPLTESYRMIRNNLQFMSLDKPGRSILVTSPASDDGKSVTAVNLGIVMALNGQRTIVVEADLRKPTLHKIFQVPNGKGLTNHLRDSELETNIPLIDTEVKGLRLLTAGDLPPNPSELLGSQRMEQLIASLMDEADVLIFDSPPVAYIADAAVLSKYVDGVVLVVSSGRTRRDVTRQAVFNLQQAGANILGVVLNRTADKNGRYKYKHASTNERLEPTVTRTLAGLQQAWNTLTLPHWWKRWYERYSDKRF